MEVQITKSLIKPKTTWELETLFLSIDNFTHPKGGGGGGVQASMGLSSQNYVDFINPLTHTV